MKKIILAAALILTTGILTVITRNGNDMPSVKIARANIPTDKNVLGTAD